MEDKHLGILNRTRNIVRNAFYTTYASLCRNRLKEHQKILFLLSHSRAGSTLTVNLLCTNPEIIGVGEMGVRYFSDSDFNVLRGRVYSKHRKMTITEKFLLDNLNISWPLPNPPSILHNKQLLCLFLIREGENTLSSLLSPKFPLEKSFPKSKNKDKVAFTYKYYQQRLHELENYAQIINDKKRTLYITYSQLIKDTQKVFKSLKKFLKSENSFSENYSPIPITKMKSVGDIYSEKIASGKIIKQPSQLVPLSPEIVQGCQESYRNAEVILRKYCSCVEDYI